MALDYCRQCACEITDVDSVCPECGRYIECSRMSIGKWIGFAMVVLSLPVDCSTTDGPLDPWPFNVMLFGGMAVFGLSPWREDRPKLKPPSDDGPDITPIITG